MAKGSIAKKIFWGVVIVLGVTGLVFAYKKFIAVPSANKLAEEEEAKAKLSPTPENIEAARQARITADLSTNIPVNSFPLKRGSRGSYVKNMQEWLIIKNGQAATLPRYGADGIFGSETEGAVKKYLSQTGIVTEALYQSTIEVNTSAMLNKKIYAKYDNVYIFDLTGKPVKTLKKDELAGIITALSVEKSSDVAWGVENTFAGYGKIFHVTKSHVYSK